jgi:uncharacterized protein (DUF433 family)
MHGPVAHEDTTASGLEHHQAQPFAYDLAMAVILSHPDILGGTPCFAGTRVPVESLFVSLERGHSLEYFLAQFPSVRREQALAVLAMAREDIPRLAEQEVRRAAG